MTAGPGRAASLAGLRVLDLSRVLAGPYCTMLLGDLGADVIKVELPGVGDDTRRWGPPFVGGESAYYLAVNRNKRGMTVDLKRASGRAILLRLVERADVLVHNFRPGTLERLELGWEHLRTINPRLVYCEISAFGSRGPRREQPGYDFAIQAMGGIMSLTGEPDGDPVKVGVAIVDVSAGLYALAAILAAVRARDRDGEGQRVEVSLFQSQLAWLVNAASGYLLTGEVPERHGNAHPSIVPYQSFACRDGHIVIAAGNDSQFRTVCGVLGLEQASTDPRFATNPARVINRQEVAAMIAGRTAEWSASDLLEALEKAGVPCAPINTLDRVFDDPQTRGVGAVIHAEHPSVGSLPLVRWPFELEETPGALRHAPPLLGQHTAEILDELGLTQSEIDALVADGAV